MKYVLLRMKLTAYCFLPTIRLMIEIYTTVQRVGVNKTVFERSLL